MASMADDDEQFPPHDDADLFAALGLDDPVPYVPAPEPPGNVDATARMGDVVVRVFTTGHKVRIALAGADGMATAALRPDDVALLVDMLQAGQIDARKTERGR